MKTLALFSWLAMAAAILGGQPIQAQTAVATPAVQSTPQPEGLTVAVFDFASRDKALETTGAMLAERVRVQLTAQGKLRLVARDEIQKILDEQKLGMAGLTEEATPRVGKLLGAQVLVLGRVFDVNGALMASVKVVGVETSRVYGEMVKGDPAQAEKIGDELAQKVAGLIQKGEDALVPKVRMTGNQLAEMKAKLGGKALPRVFVCVREQVANTQAADPAAQTELTYILKKIGCEVVKDSSGQLALWADGYLNNGSKTGPPMLSSVDLILIGEGFCQFASRTDDLVSSRARVELEALDTQTGKVLAVDRETFTAVDLSDQIAAKSALQEAASRLAVRLVPEAIAGWRAAAPAPKAKTGATTATLNLKP